jgi:hypothetical protein
MHKYLYQGYIETLAKRFDTALGEIQTQENFEYGEEFEKKICKVLRLALPQKYGVCRGYIVNEHDETAGDDIIIYDASRFPTLRVLDSEEKEKEWIPVEAVYAYIEAKHTLNLVGTEDDGSSLQKAMKQVAEVKKLCLRRTAVSPMQIAPYLSLQGALSLDRGPGYPAIDNPVFTMIMSRFVREKKGAAHLQSGVAIHGKLMEQRAVFEVDNRPDAMALGKEVIALPALPTKEGLPAFVSPFFVTNARTEVLTVPDLSFGLGLLLLLFALDFVRLGRLPWELLISNGFNPRN